MNSSSRLKQEAGQAKVIEIEIGKSRFRDSNVPTKWLNDVTRSICVPSLLVGTAIAASLAVSPKS